ncbi:aminotransferase class I/II-fold pyridoxal phosphate-dependent enzyme [Winogradskyella sp. PG-2]|uniref:aminotransferase class I/II-fold pyridoxal phosphate-dependent enzyme n=1 Tax=Winogradskyella sp. PG-2 TaxID=754409 RepID=UPI0004588820|nr:pyridoxal phosphate-dependent aminotransferase family protein [Winogradskyella sp. PG-2]BAO75788.1 8-amino-7-oxononanoate synthase [Winogradskyella sp. PG-2]
MLPKKLNKKLNARKANNAFRQLGSSSTLIDFSSNDYLGFSNSEVIFDKVHHYVIDNNLKKNGATGSRLLSGNHSLYAKVETQLSNSHKCEAALVFNSGYDANIGLLSSVPQRGDIIFYDEYVHASIRDGINMSNSKHYKFKHNNLSDLEQKCQAARSRNPKDSEIYIITESVFSMDGDSPNILKLTQLCTAYNANLIIDEAHALGVFKTGLVQKHHLEDDVFARIITFGKGLGCHGAAILGSQNLKDYLVNFSRTFIYTTGLPPHSLATIKMAYEELVIQSSSEKSQIKELQENIDFFKSEIIRLKLNHRFIDCESAIQCCIISGNDNVKSVSERLQNKGFDVKPILSPTVPKNQERLRFCLHSYNSKVEITEVLQLLAIFV